MNDATRVLPSVESLQELGYLGDLAKVMKLSNEICNIGGGGDVSDVLRGVRRRMYLSGFVDPDQMHIDAETHANREQKLVDGMSDPLTQETSEEYTERLRRWRNFFALRILSLMGERHRDRLIGSVASRYSEKPDLETVISKYLNGGGSVNISINDATPFNQLMDIVGATDDMPDDAVDAKTRSTLMAMREASMEVLIRNLLSGNNSFIEVGSKFFKWRHFKDVLAKMRGALSEGTIGGKAANMLLAYAVLEAEIPEFDEKWDAEHRTKSSEVKKGFELKPNVSYFLGSALFDEIMRGHQNGKILAECEVIKYRDSDSEDTSGRHEDLQERIMGASLPDYIERQLRDVFESLRGSPLIVRSSSELEDLEGASFAGQYKSVYLPNCGDEDSDFDAFVNAIKTVYGSVYTSDVINYRKEKGLLRRDEEMGILIQKLNGREHLGENGKYYYPDLSGVGMSYAPQTPGPDPRKGFMTIVHGFCERAVDKGGRIVMFDKPNMQIDPGHPYVQDDASVIDLKTGESKYVDVSELMRSGAVDGRLVPYVFTGSGQYGELDFVPGSGLRLSQKAKGRIDFKNLLEENGANFSVVIEYIVKKLEYALGSRVDVEFTANRNKEDVFEVNIVQCRAQNISEHLRPSYVPENVPDERVVLSSDVSLSAAARSNIEHVLYVDPDVSKSECEGQLLVREVHDVARAFEKVAASLPDGKFLCVSPGRFGSTDESLGLPVNMNSMAHTAGFVELTGNGWAAEPTAGTHAGQLVFERGMFNFARPIDGENGGERHGIFRKELLESTGLTGEALAEKFGIPLKYARWIHLVDAKDLGKAVTGEDLDSRLHVAQNNVDDGKSKRGAAIYLAEKDKDLPVNVDF